MLWPACLCGPNATGSLIGLTAVLSSISTSHSYVSSTRPSGESSVCGTRQREIAEYQVARADYHLKEDLGIAQGLADSNVIILDPACGTGTYLATVLRHILATQLSNNEPESVSVSRVRDAALKRVIGFEILPAAFIISHLHISRLLRQMGASVEDDERLRVYLTNALTGWASDAHFGSTLFPNSRRSYTRQELSSSTRKCL